MATLKCGTHIISCSKIMINAKIKQLMHMKNKNKIII